MSSDTSSKAMASKLSPWAVPTVVACALIPILTKALFFWDYPGMDDVFIHLRFVENIVAGDGWRYNLSDPQWIQASSSPLWVILLSLIGLVSSATLNNAMILTLLWSVVALVGMAVLSRRLIQSPEWALAPVVLLALDPWYLRFSWASMEATMALSFVLFGLVAHLSERERVFPWKTALIFGVGTYARPELFALYGLTLIDRTVWRLGWHSIRGSFLAGVLYLVTLIPWMLFSWWAFGSPLPSTYSAKTEAVSIMTVSIKIGAVIGCTYPVALVGILLWLKRIIRDPAACREDPARNQVLLLCIIIPAFLMAFYWMKRVDVQARYLLVGSPLFTLVGVASWEKILGARRGAMNIIIAATLICYGLILAFETVPRVRSFQSGYWVTHREVADFLREEMPNGGCIAIAKDIGIIGYFSGLEVLDFGSLATPETAGVTGWDDPDLHDILRRWRPTFFIRTLDAMPFSDLERENPDPFLLAHPVLEPVRSFELPGIRRLGEETINASVYRVNLDALP